MARHVFPPALLFVFFFPPVPSGPVTPRALSLWAYGLGIDGGCVSHRTSLAAPGGERCRRAAEQGRLRCARLLPSVTRLKRGSAATTVPLCISCVRSSSIGALMSPQQTMHHTCPPLPARALLRAVWRSSQSSALPARLTGLRTKLGSEITAVVSVPGDPPFVCWHFCRPRVKEQHMMKDRPSQTLSPNDKIRCRPRLTLPLLRVALFSSPPTQPCECPFLASPHALFSNSEACST